MIRAVSADHPDALEALAGYRAEIGRRYPGWDIARTPSATPAELGPPDGRFLVLYADERPAGCGGIMRLDAETAELRRLYVAAEARGTGAGRRLLEALESAARELGYTRIRLDTGTELVEAQALFRSAGYREIPAYNENPYAALWFEKALA